MDSDLRVGDFSILYPKRKNMNPYLTEGNPGHPGVQGKPFSAGQQPPNQDVLPSKIDVLGTGTFPPEAQGSVGRAQPTGLSATTQYGVPSSGIIPGESTVTGPQTHPLPANAEDGAIGKAPEPVTRESILEARQQRLQEQQDALSQQLNAGEPAEAIQPPVSTPNTNQEVSNDVEESDEEDEDS